MPRPQEVKRGKEASSLVWGWLLASDPPSWRTAWRCEMTFRGLLCLPLLDQEAVLVRHFAYNRDYEVDEGPNAHRYDE
jgi:hypothetical protein